MRGRDRKQFEGRAVASIKNRSAGHCGIENVEKVPGRVREGGTPPAQQGGMGERWKLPNWGLGRSPSRAVGTKKKVVRP